MSEDDQYDENDIVVKSCDINDISLKEISELFANPNSQKIIKLLVENEMYVNEIANKLELRVSLVVYHLAKLGELGFLSKTEKPISRKTKNHTYYKIKISAFTVTLRKNVTVKKIFKETVKIVGVGVAGIATWFSTNIIYNAPPIDRLEPYSSNPILPVVITTIVIGLGLFIIYYSKKYNKKIKDVE